METISARGAAFAPKVSEHSALIGLRQKAGWFFLDCEFPSSLDSVRAAWLRHRDHEKASVECLRWCLDMGLLFGPDTPRAEAEASVGRSVRDILLFPAYALPSIDTRELEVLGKFWVFVFHIDDEFDEVITASIAREVERVAARGLPSSDRMRALSEVSRRFEATARAQTAEYVRIFEGGAPIASSRASLAALAIRNDLVAALVRRHGVDDRDAVAMLRHFADSFSRLFEVRISEIRQRINADIELGELEYHSMRLYTIAMEPLLETTFLFQPRPIREGIERLRRTAAFQQLHDAVKLQISYVNDLVSIGKELREPNINNIAIQCIVRALGRDVFERMVNDYNQETSSERRGAIRLRLNEAVNPVLRQAIEETCGKCNALLAHLVAQAGLLDEANPASEAVAQAMIGWVGAHYLYTFEIARYAETIPFLMQAMAGQPLAFWDIADPRYCVHRANAPPGVER